MWNKIAALDSELQRREIAKTGTVPMASSTGADTLLSTRDRDLNGIESQPLAQKLQELETVLNLEQLRVRQGLGLCLAFALVALIVAIALHLASTPFHETNAAFWAVSGLLSLILGLDFGPSDKRLARRAAQGKSDNLVAQLHAVRFGERWLAGQLPDELRQVQGRLGSWLQGLFKAPSRSELRKIVARLPALLVPVRNEQLRVAVTLARVVLALVYLGPMALFLARSPLPPVTLNFVGSIVPPVCLLLLQFRNWSRLENALKLRAYLRQELAQIEPEISASGHFNRSREGKVIASTLQWEVNKLERANPQTQNDGPAIAALLMLLPLILPVSLLLSALSATRLDWWAAGVTVVIIGMSAHQLVKWVHARRSAALRLKDGMLQAIHEGRLLERMEAEYSAARREAERSTNTGVLKTAEQQAGRFILDSGSTNPDRRDHFMQVMQHGYARLAALLPEQIAPPPRQFYYSAGACVLLLILSSGAWDSAASILVAFSAALGVSMLAGLRALERHCETLWAARKAYIEYLRENLSR